MGNRCPLGLADRDTRGHGITLALSSQFIYYEQQFLLSLGLPLSLRHARLAEAYRRTGGGRSRLSSLEVVGSARGAQATQFDGSSDGL